MDEDEAWKEVAGEPVKERRNDMGLLVFLSVTGIIAAGIGVWGLIQLRNEDGCNAG